MPGYVAFGESGEHGSVDAPRTKVTKNALQEAQGRVGFTFKHLRKQYGERRLV